MGVRVYTQVMPLTSTTHQPVILSSRIIIDWSDLQSDAHVAQRADDVKHLMAWIQIHPKRQNIHVVFGGYRNHHETRKLQSRLQAMGCTIIARHAARSAA